MCTTEHNTLSLHDALPIYIKSGNPTVAEPDYHHLENVVAVFRINKIDKLLARPIDISHLDGEMEQVIDHEHEDNQAARSEEHTSELQSRRELVCRLLLEKK